MLKSLKPNHLLPARRTIRINQERLLLVMKRKMIHSMLKTFFSTKTMKERIALHKLANQQFIT
jgi:hypothetical protein